MKPLFAPSPRVDLSHGRWYWKGKGFLYQLLDRFLIFKGVFARDANSIEFDSSLTYFSKYEFEFSNSIINEFDKNKLF